MNIISTIFPVNQAANNSVRAVFELVDFLRKTLPDGPQWIVAGSGNGTSGGMGSDVITSVNDLIGSTSWVVLENPDSTIQLLFGKTGSDTWQCYLNPNSNYSGGTSTTRPTSATNFQYYGTETLWDDTDNGFIAITADSDYPYGFALYGGIYADFNAACCIAVIPLDDDTRNPDVYKYLVTAGDDDSGPYTVSMMSTDSDNTLVNPRIRGVNILGTGVTNIAALLPKNFSDDHIVYKCGTSYPDSFHTHIPIVWASVTMGYYGISSFASWTTSQMSDLSTSGANDRILFGDTVFPWDGVTKARRNP